VTHPSIHAQTHPDKPAYIMAASGETVTYGQLDARSNRGAQLFRSLGLKPGDHIALFLDNNARFFEICWAAQRAGLYYTAISSRLTASEVEYIVGDCGAQAFIAGKSLQEVARGLAGKLPRVRHWFSVEGDMPGYRAWEQAIAAQPATPILDEVAGYDMLYSSGTTGRPKGIKAPFLNEPITATNPLLALSQKLYGIDGNTFYLSPAPLYHAAPLRFNMTIMRMGGTSLIMEHFDAEEYLRLVQQHRITHSQLVPTMFVRILKLPEEVRKKYDVSSLKCAIHAAAPCPVKVKEQMIQWWGPILTEYYAGTEGNGFCAVAAAEWLTHRGTVGKALIGELKIMGENGEELPTGEPGTIYFANGRPFSYHNDADKTQQAFNEQGWSTLGDIGYVDAEGYLYLTDRKAYMIISGGVNIYPQEVEDLLVTHPKVADVAVFGVPSEQFGEEVKAVVQAANPREAGADLAQELIAFCRQHLSAVKCPKSVDFEVELPRHPTGKLYKRLLRDRYWGDSKKRIA
jgi:acyl-CoA synthetase (AMP-forming)/AMP-acid ligase II